MIIRSNQQSNSVRVEDSSLLTSSQAEKVLTIEAFRFEIEKEISRSNRRQVGPEFAIIRFPDVSPALSQVDLAAVVARLRERIRISDSIGWLDSNPIELAVLLPETSEDGALTLANELCVLLSDENPIDSEVSMFPADDSLRVPDVDDDDEGNMGSPMDAPKNGESVSQEVHDGSQSNSSFASRRVSDSSMFFRSSPTPWWKRTVDVVGAGGGLIALSPVFLVAAIAIKASSKGPVFFRQMREGKDGKVFGILKFRTMVVDAEAQQDSLRGQNEQDGPAFKIENDPRITATGKYLRKSCVDELPQLVNVLLGQMSLVGPRPLPVGESHGCAAWQRARLTVLPGLTCIWQAHGGRDVKFEEWMRMDLEYIKKRGFWFDTKLIVETALLALLHRGSV
jgi:lipopolysaccharide/colanic/teichoic acid biosynthesis glycosyltransferase